MATQLEVRRWSYDEFARLPDDGNRYEVIDGELFMTPSPRSKHQRIANRLGYLLEGFTQEHKLGDVFSGPIDVLFAEGDCLAPDLVFVRRERMGIVTERGIEAAPDLVVEILSSSTSDRDRGIKRERYAWFGVPEYWVVDEEEKQVEVYRMTEDPVEPQVVRDTLKWQLAPGAPALEISVPQLLREIGS